MTFGRWILLSRSAALEIAAATPAGARLLAHELVHVAQYMRDGPASFLIRYAAAYVIGRSRGLSHFDAYAAVPYEREAARAERDFAAGWMEGAE